MKKATQTDDTLSATSENISPQAAAKKLRAYFLSLLDNDNLLIPAERNGKQALTKLINILEQQAKNPASGSGSDPGSDPESKQKQSDAHILELAKQIIRGFNCIFTKETSEQSLLRLRFLELIPEGDLALSIIFQVPVLFLNSLISGVNVLPKTTEELRLSIAFSEEFNSTIQRLHQNSSQVARISATLFWLSQTQIYSGLYLKNLTESIDANNIIQEINALLSPKGVQLCTVEEITQCFIASKPAQVIENTFFHVFNVPYAARGYALALNAAFRKKGYPNLSFDIVGDDKQSILGIDSNLVKEYKAKMDLDAKAIPIDSSSLTAAKTKKKTKRRAKGHAGSSSSASSGVALPDDKKSAGREALEVDAKDDSQEIAREIAGKLQTYLSLFNSIYLRTDLELKGIRFQEALTNLVDFFQSPKIETDLELSELGQSVYLGLECINQKESPDKYELLNRLLELFPEQENLLLITKFRSIERFLNMLTQEVNVLPTSMEDFWSVIISSQDLSLNLSLDYSTLQSRISSTTLWLYETQIYDGIRLDGIAEIIDANMIINLINSLLSPKGIRSATVEEMTEFLLGLQPVKVGDKLSYYQFDDYRRVAAFSFALKAAFRKMGYPNSNLDIADADEEGQYLLGIDSDLVKKYKASPRLDLTAKFLLDVKTTKAKPQAKGLVASSSTASNRTALLRDKKSSGVKLVATKETESAEAKALRAALTVLGITQPERVIRINEPKKALSVHYLIEREQEAKDSLQMLRDFFKVFEAGGLGKTTVMTDPTPSPASQVYSCSYVLTQDQQKSIFKITARADQLQQILKTLGIDSIQQIKIIMNEKNHNKTYFQLYFNDRPVAEREFKIVNDKLGSKRAIKVQQDAQGFYFLVNEDQAKDLIDKASQPQQEASGGPGPASILAADGSALQAPAQTVSSAVSQSTMVTPSGNGNHASPYQAPTTSAGASASNTQRREVKKLTSQPQRNHPALFSKQRQQGMSELAAGPGPASSPAATGAVPQPPAQTASSATSQSLRVTPSGDNRPSPYQAPAVAHPGTSVRAQRQKTKFVAKSKGRSASFSFAPGGPPMPGLDSVEEGQSPLKGTPPQSPT